MLVLFDVDGTLTATTALDAEVYAQMFHMVFGVALPTTGAWEQSARVKLSAAGIKLGQRVLIGSDFHPSREEIVREAWRRSGTMRPAVYVGDGLWDLRAARALGLPFVGVDPEGTGTLRGACVRQVVPGYQDHAAFISALHEAADEFRDTSRDSRIADLAL